MPGRIWTRSILSHLLLVLIAGGLLITLLSAAIEQYAQTSLVARLTDQARAVSYAAAPLLREDAPIARTQALVRDLAGIFRTHVTLLRVDGVVVGDSASDSPVGENPATAPEIVQALAHPGTPGTARRQSLLYVALAFADPTAPSPIFGVVRIGDSITAFSAAQDIVWSPLVLVALLVSVFALLLGTWLARSLTQPLRRLQVTIQRFGHADLRVRADTTVETAVDDLNRTFNTMADTVSRVIQERTTERNQLGAVLLHMHDGIILTDAQRQVVGLNPAAARLFAADAPTRLGRSFIELTRDYELHHALQAALADPLNRQQVEITTGPYTLAAVATAVPNPDGGPLTGLMVLQDITEVRRLERVRRDFIANISHELRTPLASVKLLVDTLSTAMQRDPEVAEDFLRRVDIEVDRLTQLVHELLELSRLESGQVPLARQPIAAAALLTRAVERLQAQAQQGGLTVRVQAPATLPLADVDATRLEQVLVNLLHNAIKFTPAGGQITLQAQLHPTGLLFIVADTGVGIPPEDVSRIFERFYKVDKARTGGMRREGGTGLGLAIAKHTIQAHGGQIWVESQLDHGTTFFFTLPAVVSPPTEEP